MQRSLFGFFWIVVTALLALGCTEQRVESAPPVAQPEEGKVNGRMPPKLGTVRGAASSAPGYCPASGGSTEYESIQKIQLSQLPNGTYKMRVDVFIANPTGCTAGSECPEYDTSPEYVNVWLDFNGNKVFDGAEKVMDGAGTGYLNINYSGTMTFTKTFVVPAGAQPKTWLRANLGWSTDPNDPCTSNWTWGNIIDQEVTLEAPRIKEVKVEGKAFTCNPHQATSEANAKKNPITTKDVKLEAKVELPDGWSVKKAVWSGDVKPGEGNPYTYKPAKGTHGKKKAAVIVLFENTNGDQVRERKEHEFELFFGKCLDDDGNGRHNWYDYWAKGKDGAVTKHELAKGSYQGGSYTGNQYGQTSGPGTKIKLWNRTAMDCAYDFKLKDSTDGNKVVYDFNTNGKGIDCLAITLFHEYQHQTTDTDWKVGGTWNGKADADNDELPDDWEDTNAKLGFDKTKRYSFTAKGFPFGDDEEVLCEMIGYKKTGTGNKDWAALGKQSDPEYKGFPAETGTDAALTGTLSDTTIDEDADGLFDALVLEVGMDVGSPGTYTLFATMVDSEDNLHWASAEEVMLQVGVQKVALAFPGEPIRKNRVDGPWTVQDLTLLGAGWGDGLEPAWQTSAYAADQFEFDGATIGSGPYADAGVDADADGVLEAITVTVPILSEIVADAELTAWLSGPGGALTSATASASLVDGTQDVVLSFDAKDLQLAAVAGPYTITDLTLDVDGETVDLIGDAGQTQAYSLAQLGAGPATVTAYSDAGQDNFGAGSFDKLAVTIELDVDGAGIWAAAASLKTPTGVAIESVDATVEAAGAGSESITLIFDGGKINAAGEDGSYLLTGVTVVGPDGGLAAIGADHTTQAYAVSDFSPPLVVLEGIVGETATDLDADGKFDELTIDISVTPALAGNIFAEGRLVTSDGDEIAIETAVLYIEGGQTASVPLAFNAVDIHASLTDGPYLLETLNVYHAGDPGQDITVFDAYTTQAYEYAAFTEPPLITGKVIGVDWEGVAGVLVSTSATAFDFTDEDGEFTIVPDAAGAATITVDATGFDGLTPTVSIDGVDAAAGFTADVTVAVGAPVEVVFDMTAADDVAPEVAITSPADGSTFESHLSVDVEVTASDALSGLALLVVKLDGAGIAQDATIELAALDLGDHTILATATDGAGNSAQATATFTITEPTDQEAPVITISSPVEQDYDIGETILLEASATDAGGVASLTLEVDGEGIENGTPVPASSFGLGQHTVTAVAFDTVGNKAVATVTFTVSSDDTGPPEITVVSPEAKEYAWNASIEVDVEVTDDTEVSGTTITLDGDPIANGAVLDALALTAGEHTLAVSASDVLAQVTTAEVIFSVQDAPNDQEGPVITIVSPEATDYATWDTAVVDVSAEDESGVDSLTTALDGEPIEAGATIVMADLALGQHTLSAEATDVHGSTSTAEVVFAVVEAADATAPTVAIVTPEAGKAYAPSDEVVVEVTADDEESGIATLVIALDGAPVNDGDTLLMADLSAGEHTLVATATDVAGNEATAEAAFTVTAPADLEPPVVTILAPEDGKLYARTEVVTPNVEATDNGEVVELVFYLDAAILDAQADIVMADLADGAHEFLARAVDAAGNDGEATVTFEVEPEVEADTTPPVITISSPAAQEYDSDATIAVTVEVTDETAVATIEYTLDGVKLEETESLSAADLGEGEHTFGVTAADSAGNESSESVTFDVRAAAVDTGDTGDTGGTDDTGGGTGDTGGGTGDTGSDTGDTGGGTGGTGSASGSCTAAGGPASSGGPVALLALLLMAVGWLRPSSVREHQAAGSLRRRESAPR